MIKLTENIFMISGATNTGVIHDSENNVYLVDSGNTDKDALQIEEELKNQFGNYKLKGIFNTHSHADHAGGNFYFQSKNSCRIFISPEEKPLLENQALHPALIWGANPIPEIANEYLAVKKCSPTDIVTENSEIILNEGIKVNFVELPGHYFQMMGIIVSSPEGKKAFFLGDGVLGYRNINKYWISFLLDYRKALESIKKINSIKADFYIPSHGEISETIDATCEMNQIAILSTETCILNILEKQSLTNEELLKAVADKNGIKLKMMQYGLILSTIKSYLTVLYKENKVQPEITDNILRWKKVQ